MSFLFRPNYFFSCETLRAEMQAPQPNSDYRFVSWLDYSQDSVRGRVRTSFTPLGGSLQRL
jgi:hypothetical protein